MLKKKGMIGALTAATAVSLLFVTAPAFAGVEEAKKWVESEFQPSTLSKEEQMKEMEWLVNAAKPFAGMEINVVSETITTHEYESKVLAKAFSEITGQNIESKAIKMPEPVRVSEPQVIKTEEKEPSDNMRENAIFFLNNKLNRSRN